MDEMKRIVKSLIQTNAAVYELILNWIEANTDEGLKTTGVSSKSINFFHAKTAVIDAIDQVKAIAESVENIQ